MTPHTVWNTAFYTPVVKHARPRPRYGINGTRPLIDRDDIINAIQKGNHTVGQMAKALNFSPESLRRHLYTMTELGVLKATQNPGQHTKWEIA